LPELPLPRIQKRIMGDCPVPTNANAREGPRRKFKIAPMFSEAVLVFGVWSFEFSAHLGVACCLTPR
jgi:hypothetical protein